MSITCSYSFKYCNTQAARWFPCLFLQIIKTLEMNVSIWGQTSDLISTGDQIILWSVFLATYIRQSPCIKWSLSYSPGWPLNTGSTVFGQVIRKVRSSIQNWSSKTFSAWSSQSIWYKPKILKTKEFEHNLSPMILHVIGNQMVYSWNCTFRLRKLLGFGQNMCESIPYFHSTAFDYTY